MRIALTILEDESPKDFFRTRRISVGLPDGFSLEDLKTGMALYYRKAWVGWIFKFADRWPSWSWTFFSGQGASDNPKGACSSKEDCVRALVRLQTQKLRQLGETARSQMEESEDPKNFFRTRRVSLALPNEFSLSDSKYSVILFYKTHRIGSAHRSTNQNHAWNWTFFIGPGSGASDSLKGECHSKEDCIRALVRAQTRRLQQRDKTGHGPMRESDDPKNFFRTRRISPALPSGYSMTKSPSGEALRYKGDWIASVCDIGNPGDAHRWWWLYHDVQPHGDSNEGRCASKDECIKALIQMHTKYLQHRNT